jgi:hypothetical protein
MSSEITGQSRHLNLRVEPSGIVTIDARVIARLDVLDFMSQVTNLPFQMWAALIIRPKPESGVMPAGFFNRARREALFDTLEKSGASDDFLVESTMSPPKSGTEGRKWPAIVVWAFLEPSKFAQVYETLKTAFLAPDSTYDIALEHFNFNDSDNAPARATFDAWRTAKQPIIAIAQISLTASNEKDGGLSVVRLLRTLVALAAIGALALVAQCAR